MGMENQRCRYGPTSHTRPTPHNRNSRWHREAQSGRKTSARPATTPGTHEERNYRPNARSAEATETKVVSVGVIGLIVASALLLAFLALGDKSKKPEPTGQTETGATATEIAPAPPMDPPSQQDTLRTRGLFSDTSVSPGPSAQPSAYQPPPSQRQSVGTTVAPVLQPSEAKPVPLQPTQSRDPFTTGG